MSRRSDGSLTQFVAFAAGRALIPVENRYLDTLLIGLAVNMISLFWLATIGPGRRASARFGGPRP